MVAVRGVLSISVRLTCAHSDSTRTVSLASITFVRAGPEPAIRRVIEACALPDCRLLLAPGEPKLDRLALGETIPRSLAYHVHSGAFTGYRDGEWDFGVAVAPLVTSLSEQLPAFFAAIVAHELGHVRIALADPSLHVYSLFLWQHRGELGACQSIKYHALPTERACNQFAVLVATRLFNRRQLRDECVEAAALKPVRLGPHASVLSDLEGEDALGGIRAALAATYLPCANSAADAWAREHAAATRRGTRSFTNDAPPIETLFAPLQGAT